MATATGPVQRTCVDVLATEPQLRTPRWPVGLLPPLQEPLDTSLPGYQPPLPESEVKPLQVGCVSGGELSAGRGGPRRLAGHRRAVRAPGMRTGLRIQLAAVRWCVC